MEIIDNYKVYRKNKPQYKDWKKEKTAQEQARLDYINKNGVSEAQKQEDIKRARAILNAVDVMDEYSQSRAEDMEMVTQSIISSISTPVMYGGIGLGVLCNFIKPIKPFTEKIAGFFGSKEMAPFVMPIVIGLGTILASVPIMSAWGAKKELQASRTGRLESMNKELASVKQFAILTEEQEQKRDEIAKTIEISPKEKKKGFSASRGFGIKNSLSVIKNGDKEYQEYNKVISEKTKEDKAKFNTVKLSAQDIEEAKKDKQLIQNIVEKIDIASQDYAENIELVTTVLSSAALGSGGILGFGLNAVFNALKKASENSKSFLSKGTAKNVVQTITKHSKIISAIIGIGTAVAGTIYATKLQKQGSRVARFKVKEELLNNPNQLIYVDDDKIYADNTNVETKKKTNFFKFLIQAVKDNKEYNNYTKTKGVEQKQKAKAQEEIELTPEQEKRAQQLQQNVFKMFNKLDEKSQSFAESTEALGETLQTYVSMVPALFASFGINKIIDQAAEHGKVSAKSVLPIILSFIPTIAFNVWITKDQKNASRVADMMAIKEMDDYRNFVDYSNLHEDSKKEEAPKKMPAFTNITPPWKK